MNWKIVIGAIVALGFAGVADAYGSLRCKGRLIDVGDTMEEVASLCGEPAGRSIEEIPTRTRVGAGYSRLTGITTNERWVYDRGWGRFPVVLTFDQGRVRHIDYLPVRSGD